MFARAARRGTATRIRTGALSLLAAVAILSGTGLMQALQCGDGMTRRLATQTAAAMSAHDAPAAALGGAGEGAGQLAGAGDNRDDSEPCMSAQAATTTTAAALTGAGVTHSRTVLDSPRGAATDLPHATDLGRPLSRSCVLRT